MAGTPPAPRPAWPSPPALELVATTVAASPEAPPPPHPEAHPCHLVAPAAAVRSHAMSSSARRGVQCYPRRYQAARAQIMGPSEAGGRRGSCFARAHVRACLLLEGVELQHVDACFGSWGKYPFLRCSPLSFLGAPHPAWPVTRPDFLPPREAGDSCHPFIYKHRHSRVFGLAGLFVLLWNHKPRHAIVHTVFFIGFP